MIHDCEAGSLCVLPAIGSSCQSRSTRASRLAMVSDATRREGLRGRRGTPDCVAWEAAARGGSSLGCCSRYLGDQEGAGAP